jgi:hypothetical protein
MTHGLQARRALRLAERALLSLQSRADRGWPANGDREALALLRDVWQVVERDAKADPVRTHWAAIRTEVAAAPALRCLAGGPAELDQLFAALRYWDWVLSFLEQPERRVAL